MGNFFDVKEEYYMPYLLWGLALCVFNLILNKNKINIYTKDINMRE